MSISNVLGRIRRRRIFTLLACVILFVAAGQLLLFKGSQSASAEPVCTTTRTGKSCDMYVSGVRAYTYLVSKTSVVTDCELYGSTLGWLPAECEGANVRITQPITIDAGVIPVWQHAGSFDKACASSVTDDGVKWTFAYVSSTPLLGHERWEYVVSDPTQAHCVYSYGTGVGSNRYGGYVPIKYTAGSVCTSVVGITNVQANYMGLTYGAANPDCDTKRHFKSLIVQVAPENTLSAKITHSAVTVQDFIDTYGSLTVPKQAMSFANATTGTARWKKVDIETTGDIVLGNPINSRDHSTIDVSGMGYPGGDQTTLTSPDTTGCWFFQSVPGCSNNTGLNGYGPGGGTGGSLGDKILNAGGAGYGGIGQTGSGTDGSLYPGGHPYSDANLTTFDFGSGGGNGIRRSGKYHAAGGAGGGRVRLVSLEGTVNIFSGSSIRANGNEGVGAGDTGSARGGSGSGGAIYISYAQNPSAESVYSGSVSGNTDAENGTIQIDGAVWNGAGSEKTLSANGGAHLSGGYWKDIAGIMRGAGGRIYIRKIQLTGVNVNKRLEAVYRASANPHTDFNPYALQKDDIIKSFVYIYTC